MKGKTIRLSDDILKISGYLSKKEDVEESTMLRKLIKKGGIKLLSELFRAGEISLRDVARVLGVSLYEALDIMFQEGVRGNITAEQVFESLESVKKTPL